MTEITADVTILPTVVTADVTTSGTVVTADVTTPTTEITANVTTPTTTITADVTTSPTIITADVAIGMRGEPGDDVDLTEHEATHPIPTIRDSRNQVAGSYADALTDDENYVSDAELVVIQATSGTNTGDQTNISGNAATATNADMLDSIHASGFLKSYNITAIKDANYTAVVNDYVRCNASINSFTITLPETPANQSRIKVVLTGAGAGVVTIGTSGSDVFTFTAGSATKMYIDVRNATFEVQYDSAGAFWLIRSTGSPVNYANNFPGIDASTPLTEADVTFDTGTLVLTIDPPLGYFNVMLDGDGKTKRYRKTGLSTFPAITNTSGYWYFYYDIDGVAIATQTSWKSEEFPVIATVYRILWNATLAPSSRAVAEYVEYHLNTISAQDHGWKHLEGSKYVSGLELITNAITSGSPNADGRNTVVGMTTGAIIDDNLKYTVTNSTSGTAWNQDLGSISAGSLTAATGAEFEIHTQDAGGLQSDLPATKYPFPFSGSNIIEYITSVGVRTEVQNLYYSVVFILGSQNPRTGEAIEIVTSTEDFSTIVGARAYTWSNIQSAYPLIGIDLEIRPLYRLIFQKKSIYDVGTKYAVLRETTDLRKAVITQIPAASGSIPATSVTVAPVGDIIATNAQAAFEELDIEKEPADATIIKQADVDDVAVNGASAVPISSNWAFDHAADAAAHGAYNNYVHPNHSGDVTSMSDGAQTIVTAAVTNVKMADMVQSTIKGRITASTGLPEDLTATQVRTLINVADGADVTSTNETSHADVLIDGDIGATVAAALGADDNYVTDAEKTLLGNTSGTNSGDNPGVTSVAGTSPVVSSGGVTPAISIPAATNTSAGHATASHIQAIEALIDSLTGDVMADSEHRHSELSASDGSPNPAVSVDVNGNIGFGGNINPATEMDLTKASGTAKFRAASLSLASTEEAGVQAIGTSAGGSQKQAFMGIYYNTSATISTEATGYFRMDANDDRQEYLWLDNSDMLRVSSTKTHVGSTNGTIIGTQSSDGRLKIKMKPLPYGLGEIKQINPISFKYKADTEEKKQIGLLAQEVVNIVPEAVYETHDNKDGVENVYAMDYTNLIPVLINSIKELIERIEALEN